MRWAEAAAVPLTIARILAVSFVAAAGAAAPNSAPAPAGAYGNGLVLYEEAREGEVLITKFRMRGRVTVPEMALLLQPYMSRRCERRLPALDSYERETRREKKDELVTGATIRFRCREAPAVGKADPHSFVKDMCGEFRASQLLQEACAPFLE